MPNPLPSPEEAPPTSALPTFHWLDPLYHLETLIPLRPERDGWFHYSSFIVRCLSAVGLASDLHCHVLNFLHPGAFCHAFVPVVHPSPSIPLLICDDSATSPSRTSAQSSFGGDELLWPLDNPIWPRCQGCNAAPSHNAAPGCGSVLTPLCQLRVGDLPLILKGGVCPAWVSDDDVLQCFVCLRCHFVEDSHPVYGHCRWVRSAGAKTRDPSADLVVDVNPALNGTDVYLALKRADVQPTFAPEEQQQGDKAEPGYVFPRMRLSHWLCIRTRPSKEAETAMLMGERETAGMLMGERAEWGRAGHSTPFYVRMGGYEVHRQAAVEQRCGHKGEGGGECWEAMHLLLTFPSGRVLPMRWHRGYDLWLYQCSVHRDVFRLVAVN